MNTLPEHEERQKQTASDRLAYTGDLEPVVERLCDAFAVGDLRDFSVIEVGYEDCNVKIKTSTGTYLAKIFAKKRTPEHILRYTTIMQKAIQAGVQHPELMKTREDGVVHVDQHAHGISMVLMRFIPGQTYLDIDRAPTPQETKAIVEQAALVHQIDHRPEPYFDIWAIPNIETLFSQVQQFIAPDDLRLVERVIEGFNAIPLAELPHCFVHGDFTKANVLRGDDGRMYILDFSVSNWAPRIQELAVMSANLLYAKENSSLRESTETAAALYEQFHLLTPLEKESLYPYALAGAAMEFIGPHLEKYVHGNDNEETAYWLELGRNVLMKELS